MNPPKVGQIISARPVRNPDIDRAADRWRLAVALTDWIPTSKVVAMLARAEGIGPRRRRHGGSVMTRDTRRMEAI